MRSKLAVATLLCSASLSAGCGHLPFFRSDKVGTADEIASIHLSALSVSSWDTIEADLQPTFPIDPAAALNLAVPTTGLFEERFFDALSLALRVATPTATESSKTTTSGASGSTTTARENVSVESTGDISAVEDPALISGGASAIPSRIGDWKISDMDPMLKYLAATAIFQEVKLLNRYVKDTVQWEGSHAFAVRLQLTALPHRRSLSYDSITDITFFPQDLQAAVGLSPAGKPPAQGPCASGKTDRVAVVPMLVTDNLEGMLRSRSADSIRQFGLSLLAMIDGVGAGSDFNRTSERLQQILGRDLNSMLTVARVSDDTVRVRLGAVQNTDAQYSMLPRTNNITMLVIYRPCDPAKIPATLSEQTLTAVSHTSFIDTATGQIVPSKDHLAQTAIDADTLNRRYHLKLSVEQYLLLYVAASNGDWTKFSTSLSAMAPELLPIVQPGLWVDLIGLRSRGEYSFTPIPVKVRKTEPTLPAEQLALVADDKGGASVTLLQAKDLRSHQVGATMLIGKTRIPARSVDVSGNTTLKATFPPLAKLISDAPKDTPVLELSGKDVATTTYAVRIIAPEKEPEAKPGFSITVPSSVIVAGDGGIGRANIIIKAVKDGSKEPLFVAISGADVRSVEKVRGTPLSDTADGWKIASAGEAALVLGNLAPGQQVTLSVRDAKGGTLGQAEVRQVISGPATRER